MAKSNRQGYPVNPVKDQDRVRDLFEHFEQYGDVMFRQQRAIYQGLAKFFNYKSVVEFGCGNGVGSAIIAQERTNTKQEYLATDILRRNIEFARCLFPWIGFGVYDITRGTTKKYQCSVAVEVIEHVASPLEAIAGMIESSTEEVWISTPNGTGNPRPPENPYHVCEYTPEEVLDMLFTFSRVKYVSIWDWDKLDRVPATCFRETRDPLNLLGNPLVYRALIV